jgi:hypothetical protein
MSKPKILTREIAEKFLKDNDSVDLEKFTSLEDDAAKVLAEHKGSLRLNGITTLAKAAASYLAKAAPLPGEDNNFINLESLIPSIDVARQLAKYQGDQIEFDLASIDLPFVKAMAPFKGNLWLGNVSQLDDDVAGALAKRSGGAYLDGVQEYKDGPGHLALVSALVEWNKDHWLGLRGLNKISHGALVALAEYDGPELLANPPIKKQILALKRKQAITKIKEGKLKEPEEWQNRRIVLSKPPLKPLKGRNAERAIAGDATWWLPKTVCNWFVERLEESHKVNISAGGFGEGKIKHISPEAAELLRLKSTEWLWLMEKEKASEKGRELKVLESVATIEVPREFQNGRIVLTSPKKPLAEAYRWKPDFEGEDYAAVLQFYGYLPEDHVGSITDSNGYPAKTTTPEAADLYRRHRAFWEGKHAESKAQAKAVVATRKKTAKENFKKAVASSGLSREQLEAKLDLLSELVERGNFNLVVEMVAGSGDPWLYEALLAGAYITAEGDLKPGKELKRFKQHSKIMMLIVIAHLPNGVQADETLHSQAEIAIDVIKTNLELLGQLASRLPKLRAATISDYEINDVSREAAQFLARHAGNLRLDSLTKLSDEAAAALAKHDGDLSLKSLISFGDYSGHIALAQKLAATKDALILNKLESLSDGAAAALARHKGELSLGVRSLSDEAAEALAKHGGALSLNSLTSLGDSLGHIALARKLAQKKGILSLNGLKSISDEAAATLAKHDGDLLLNWFNSLSKSVAIAFAKHKGNLYLKGVAQLSVEAATALAQHKGNLSLGVQSLSDEAAAALAKHDGELSLDCLISFNDSPGHIALAQKLAQKKGILSLNGLKSISDAAVVALADHTGYLSLNGLTHLSDELAKYLGKHGGPINLIRLEKLSAYGANQLVNLSSVGLLQNNLSPEAQEAFKKAGSFNGKFWTRNP